MQWLRISVLVLPACFLMSKGTGLVDRGQKTLCRSNACLESFALGSTGRTIAGTCHGAGSEIESGALSAVAPATPIARCNVGQPTHSPCSFPIPIAWLQCRTMGGAIHKGQLSVRLPVRPDDGRVLLVPGAVVHGTHSRVSPGTPFHNHWRKSQRFFDP